MLFTLASINAALDSVEEEDEEAPCGCCARVEAARAGMMAECVEVVASPRETGGRLDTVDGPPRDGYTGTIS